MGACKHAQTRKEMVFCYQNYSDLLREKNVLKSDPNEIIFSWHSGFEGHKFLHFLSHFGKKRVKMSYLHQDSNLQSGNLKPIVLTPTPLTLVIVNGELLSY